MLLVVRQANGMENAAFEVSFWKQFIALSAKDTSKCQRFTGAKGEIRTWKKTICLHKFIFFHLIHVSFRFSPSPASSVKYLRWGKLYAYKAGYEIFILRQLGFQIQAFLFFFYLVIQISAFYFYMLGKLAGLLSVIALFSILYFHHLKKKHCFS